MLLETETKYGFFRFGSQKRQNYAANKRNDLCKFLIDPVKTKEQVDAENRNTSPM